MINIKQLEDYLFCKEYWSQNRESHNKLIDISAQRERYIKRQKQNEFLERLFEEQKPTKKKKKQQKKSFFNRCIELYRSLKKKSLIRKLSFSQIKAEEIKDNDTLLLADVSYQKPLYGEISQIKLENGSIVFTLARTEEKQSPPSYQPNSRYSDLIVLSAYLYLIKLHFPRHKVLGKIDYGKNTSSNIHSYEYGSSKMVKAEKIMFKLLDEINNGKTNRVIPVFPFRCPTCPLYTQCDKKMIYPIRQLKGTKEEDPKYLLEEYLRLYTKLLKSSWSTWKGNLKEYNQFLHSHKKTRTVLEKILNKKTLYDMQHLVQTGVFHERDLYNSYMSKKELPNFQYQLMLYLDANRILTPIKELMKAYGLTQFYDHKSNHDILIHNFLEKELYMIHSLIKKELSLDLPVETVKQIVNNYTVEHGQINIANDQGKIEAKINLFK
ncbi:hypothetical protein [Risungbinella massiliensis]|uniref:hypothetical protein n=1 Tax=Risungbinella massiliensis TaxID=1329796 RepID=UPI0005CBF6EA|nr:hypothetical protein [Risungbinella massiliensis]